MSVEQFKEAVIMDFQKSMIESAKKFNVDRPSILSPALVSICIHLLSGSIAAIRNPDISEELVREGFELAIQDLRESFENHLKLMDSYIATGTR